MIHSYITVVLAAAVLMLSATLFLMFTTLHPPRPGQGHKAQPRQDEPQDESAEMLRRFDEGVAGILGYEGGRREK